MRYTFNKALNANHRRVSVTDVANQANEALKAAQRRVSATDVLTWLKWVMAVITGAQCSHFSNEFIICGDHHKKLSQRFK